MRKRREGLVIAPAAQIAPGQNEEGRRCGRPWFAFFCCCCCLAGQRSSGERGLAVPDQQVLVSYLRSERVVLFLEPHKLGFQVPNTLLEAAHLGYHAGIGTADVAE
jgi:hypothetical protein